MAAKRVVVATSVGAMPPATLRNSAGELALIAGLLAAAFAFFPIIGEYVATPASVVAVVAGVIGIRRADRGLASNPGVAWIGVGLGVAAGLVTVLVYVATAQAG